jgi:glycosyltransferase involved in cell wall biosynthesis/peptidoglycan/xylan/chitin deacetylase (PgdA/CDA1 family)
MTASAKQAAPKVSVITIFYNAERYLREAVDSVLAQDFRDFELLLVDDGSTDSSRKIAEDYSARDPRVHCLQHPDGANHGMSATRNLGLSHARGDFVAFIDADDRWRPGKLREQVELLDRLNDVDAVGGAVNYWASHGGGRDRIVQSGHVRDRAIPPGEATTRMYPLGKVDAPSMSDLLFRRKSIDRVHGFEEAFRGAYEDQAFLSKYYLHSTLYFTANVWSDYRLHPDSCMARLSPGAYSTTRGDFLAWFRNYVLTSPYRADATILKALERALWRYESHRERAATIARRVPGALGAVSWMRALKRRVHASVTAGPAILMYHRIADESFDPWGLAVSPDSFLDQIQWIARNRTILSLADFARQSAEGRLPKDAVALTFDDGYACFASDAAPMLKKADVPATVFISPELISEGREFWWDELERIVLGHELSTLRVLDQQIHIGKRSERDRSWEPAAKPSTARQHAFLLIYSMLYARPNRQVEAEMAKIRAQSGRNGPPRESHRPLRPDEVATLEGDAIEFGSHALRHPSLPLLDSESKWAEIDGSIEACTAMSGSKPLTFAYPYGDLDAESRELVSSAGYLCGCKTGDRFVGKRSDIFALPRIHVGNWDSAALARRLGRP